MSQSTAQQQRELIERHYKIMTQYQLNKELDILEMLQKSSLLKEVREKVEKEMVEDIPIEIGTPIETQADLKRVALRGRNCGFNMALNHVLELLKNMEEK